MPILTGRVLHKSSCAKLVILSYQLVIILSAIKVARPVKLCGF